MRQPRLMSRFPLWLALAALLACLLPSLALAHRPPPPKEQVIRATADIEAELAATLRELDVLVTRLAQLGREPARRDSPEKISAMAQQLQIQQQRLAGLQKELHVAHEADVAYQIQQAQAKCQALPPPPPPPPPAPAWLSGPAFAELHTRIKDLAFDRDRQAALGDAILAGARFSADQALQIQALFTFSDGQIQSATRMCKDAIVEPGALPRLIAALRFESDRKKLRKATNNRCGIGF